MINSKKLTKESIYRNPNPTAVNREKFQRVEEEEKRCKEKEKRDKWIADETRRKRQIFVENQMVTTAINKIKDSKKEYTFTDFPYEPTFRIFHPEHITLNQGFYLIQKGEKSYLYPEELQNNIILEYKDIKAESLCNTTIDCNLNYFPIYKDNEWKNTTDFFGKVKLSAKYWLLCSIIPVFFLCVFFHFYLESAYSLDFQKLLIADTMVFGGLIALSVTLYIDIFTNIKINPYPFKQEKMYRKFRGLEANQIRKNLGFKPEDSFVIYYPKMIYYSPEDDYKIPARVVTRE